MEEAPSMTLPLNPAERDTYRLHKEMLCRATLEALGFELVKFWVDDAGHGHAEAFDHNTGKVVFFEQRAREGE